MTSSPGLRLEEVSVARDVADGRSHAALDGVTAAFDADQLSFVTGPVGSGKSTLIHLLGGIEAPSTGVVFEGEEPISRHAAWSRDRWRKGVGIAFQEPKLIDELTVLDNVMLRAQACQGSLSTRELVALSCASLEELVVESLAAKINGRVLSDRASVRQLWGPAPGYWIPAGSVAR